MKMSDADYDLQDFHPFYLDGGRYSGEVVPDIIFKHMVELIEDGKDSWINRDITVDTGFGVSFWELLKIAFRLRKRPNLRYMDLNSHQLKALAKWINECVEREEKVEKLLADYQLELEKNDE